MNFEYDIKTTTGETVHLELKPYGDAPGGISRHNVNNIEAQFWAYFEWGLVGTKIEVLDNVPQREVTKCYNEWQAADSDSSTARSKAESPVSDSAD